MSPNKKIISKDYLLDLDKPDKLAEKNLENGTEIIKLANN